MLTLSNSLALVRENANVLLSDRIWHQLRRELVISTTAGRSGQLQIAGMITMSPTRSVFLFS